jgi:pimeloyl-ACP methyl ester carboxylesterase
LTNSGQEATRVPSAPFVSFSFISAAQLMLSLMVLLIALWLCAVAFIWGRQERLIFRPDARPLGDVPPSLAAVRFRPAQLTTCDGLELAFWAAEPLPGHPTLVLFHGNLGNAADRCPLLAPFAAAGYGVVMAEYRGYAGNPGIPSETGFLRDGRAYLDWVSANWQDTAPIVCGESIGSGVAVRMATERPVSAVVLDAPYTSVAELAAAMYRWLPVRALLRHPFDNMSCLPLVRAPLLVVHGDADDLIPVEHGRRVVAAAGGPAEFVLLPGAGHPAMHTDPAGLGAEAVRRFLTRLTPAPGMRAQG